ncbi:MAG: hypothetical protein AB7S48_01150 [Bacteroidales bacterium]
MEKTSWTCMYADCNEKCINSHVLQKNGILSRIEINKHIIEVKPTNIWEIDSQGIFKYQRIGINEAFSFPGFCPSHDDKIFKPIESNDVDFNNYKVQCLFSYRGLCQEIRRKEQVKQLLTNILEQRKKFSVIDIGELFEDYLNGLNLGIINLNYFKSQLENDILSNEENFEFELLIRPYAEICTSAPINIKEPNEQEPSTIEEYNIRMLNNKMPTTFISVFPTATNSIWIIGEHKKYRSTYTSHLKKLDYELALSELLILRMEYWCMSQNFLNKHITPKMNEIKALFMMNALNFEAKMKTPINLFK